MTRKIILVQVLILVACGGDPAVSRFPVRNPSEVVPAQMPTSGPWFHTIRTASSADGLTWTEDRSTDLVLHASVPAAAQLTDGTLVVYFVDFSSGGSERLGCVESKDAGATYTWGACSLSGLTSNKAVDFAPTVQADGSVKMYFYASDQNVNSTGLHAVDMATSGDGKNFTRTTTTFSYNGLVDPDVFQNSQEWIMHVFSLTDGATVRATSPDGLSFAYKDHLQPANIGVTKPVKLDNGTYRMYGFPQGPGQQVRFVSLVSPDGYTWTQEPGDRLVAPAGYEITDPYVVRLNSGKWCMVYKRSPSGK
ncbi:MAG TPA: exo-alpha-sialidase [Cyclobacteriaceae bacterium]|nr:exo-alpha-sialidase [Cyclobacteriaceae bacterium]